MVYLIKLLLFFPLLGLAASPIEDAKEIARQHHDDAKHVLQNSDVTKNKEFKELFSDYTETPSETNYYKGSEQVTTNLKEDAAVSAAKNPLAYDVKESNNNQQKIYEKDQVWLSKTQHSASVISKAASDNIEAIQKDLAKCTKERICKTDTIKKTCFNHPGLALEFCQKKLVVDVIFHQIETHYPIRYSVKMHEDNHDYAGLTSNLDAGRITWYQSREGNFYMSGALPALGSCQQIVGRWRMVRANSLSATVDGIRYPTCNDHTLDLHITSNRRLDVEVEVDLTVITTSKEYKDRWESTCQSLEKFLYCKKVQEACVIESETHQIAGEPITRDCWEKELGYQCSGSEGKNTCAPLIKEGCQLVKTKCLDSSSKDVCQYTEQTYDCPVTTCSDSEILCHPYTYCDGDDCGQSGRSPDPDFGSAIAKLSASFNSGINFDGAHIFSGNDYKCNKYAFSSVNCCADKGWLKDLTPFTKCGKEAIELGKAREEKKAIYVGHHVETANIKDMNVYCVFPSKLARIIQFQGRYQQLGIGFGTYKRPDCRGLTPKEIQKIDFGRIDFSDFITDIKTKTYDEKLLKKRIEEKMREMTQKGKKYD